jgi:RNA polymerase sigma-70 factor (ECF subfamily)
MTDIEFNDSILKLNPLLERFALSLTQNKEDANDIVQETYLKALSNQKQFQDDTNLKAWIFSILKNTFINKCRREKKLNTIFDWTKEHSYINQTLDERYASPESTLQEKEIYHLINKLPITLHTPFMMYLKGYKYREIAKELNIKEGTIKSRIFFARKELMNNINK